MKRPLACSLAAMLLASASALAGPVLPPEQYDHAFDGELIVHNNQSAGDLGRECGLIFFPVGCAHPPNTHGLNATISTSQPKQNNDGSVASPRNCPL
jgi:hypothetical protein